MSNTLCPTTWRGRRREVSVSPAREYQLRPGLVEPISMEMAALILSRKGIADLTLKGITIELKDLGGRRKYGHPDHPLCNDLSRGTKRIIAYAVNPHNPSIAHIFDAGSGAYLGSLPEKERPAALDRKALAIARAAQNRQIERIKTFAENIHPEAREIMARQNDQIERTLRAVQTQPLDNARDTTPMRSSAADAAAAATERHTVNRTARHAAMTEADDAWSSPRRPAMPVAAGLDDDDNPFT